jgi:hypothetical protein
VSEGDGASIVKRNRIAVPPGLGYESNRTKHRSLRQSAQNFQRRHAGTDTLNNGDRPLDGEIEVRQQFDLVKDDEGSGAKHMRIL